MDRASSGDSSVMSRKSRGFISPHCYNMRIVENVSGRSEEVLGSLTCVKQYLWSSA